MTTERDTISDRSVIDALAETLSVSTFALDRRGRVVRVVGERLAALGLTEAAVGRHAEDLDGETALDVAAHWDLALAGETVTETVSVPDWTFQVAYVPTVDDGSVVGVTGVVRSNARLEPADDGPDVGSEEVDLLERTSVMGVLIENRDGVPHVRDCNQAFVDELGYDRSAVVGRPLHEFYTVDSAERVVSRDAPTVEDGFRIEERDLVAADGDVVRTLVHAVPDEADEPTLIRALYIDLGGHERIRRQLHESKEKIEKLHETASAMVSCRREADVYDLAIRAAEDILEFDRCGIDIVEGEYLVPKALSSGMSGDSFEKMSLDDGVAGETYRSGESFLTPDIRESERAQPTDDTYLSAISVPIGDHGIFQAAAEEVESFDEEDVELAELLMSHVSEALDRIRSERARRESEEKYRTLVEQSTEAIFIIRDNRFLFLNDRTAEITGYPKDEIYEMTTLDLVHPDDRNWVLRIAERRAAGKPVPDTYEARILTADGDVKHGEISVTEITYGGERALLGSMRDITERKAQEQTLNALQETTREMMLAKTPDDVASLLVRTAVDVLDCPMGAVWFVDDAGVLRPVVATESARENDLPAFERGDGSDAWDVFETGEIRSYDSAVDRPAVLEPFRSSVLSPLGDHGVLAVGSVDEDEVHDTQVDLVKLLAANAETALDRAARERLLRDRERELETQNEKLEFLNSLLRHHILNGMTVMLGRVDLLKDAVDERHLSDLETVSAWGDDIVRSVRRIRRLMDSAVGQVDTEPSPVSLSAVLTEEVGKLRAAYPDATIGASVDDATVLGDDMLAEVFENLLSNAIVHNDGDAPTVDVETTVGEGSVAVRIADDGPGIPPEKHEEIFGRGKKGLRSPGTGYGLYLADTIVTQYGGEILVESDGESGTTFVVSLPLA